MINSKVYVGQTIRTLDVRWKAHQNERHSGTDRPICRALRKYGVHSFKIEEITKATSKDNLDELEAFWIIELDSMNPAFGYNARAGGNNTTFCEETKKKMSLAKKGKPARNKGIPCSIEAAKKISAANKGRPSWNKGIPQSEERKKRHSDTMKGRKAWNVGLRINNKEIVAINLETNEETLFSSIHEVVSVLKVGRCAVQNVLSGRGKRTSNNYTYKYNNYKDL